MKYYTLNLLASTYGSGNYNNTTYNGSSTTTASGSGTNGTLSNTGIAVMSIVTVAALILLVALVVRIWKRPSRKVVPVESDDEQQQRPTDVNL
jgi:hypothetical protein